MPEISYLDLQIPKLECCGVVATTQLVHIIVCEHSGRVAEAAWKTLRPSKTGDTRGGQEVGASSHGRPVLSDQ